ncbi:MAG: hypothetical protein ACREQB_07170, partial [Candidatus Binataceae bacterium]
MAAQQNLAPILILLALAISFLYLHFSGGSGLARLYLAVALVAASVVLLLPTFSIAMPDWYKTWLGGAKIQLGLDLQGGTHLLMEVKLEEAVSAALKRRGDDLKRELKKNNLEFDAVSLDPSANIAVKLKSSDERTAFLDLLQSSFPDLAAAPVEVSGPGPGYRLEFKPRDLQQLRASAMEQALETIRNRIDQLGVRETTVAREGDSNILVQLPGIQDPQRAKELIGKTAVLQFKLVDDQHNVQDSVRDGPPPGDDILYG